MAHPDSREMYEDLFKGTAAASVSVPILEEELKKAQELIEANKWDQGEGLIIIFSNGLYYLLGEAQLHEVPSDDSALAERVKRLTGELMDMQSKYAVMKFRAFSLNQEKQTLGFNVVGLETENRWSGERLKKFREDEKLLRAQLQDLRRENESLRRRSGDSAVTAPEPEDETRGPVRRFLRRLW